MLGVVFVGTVASTVRVFRVNTDVIEERFTPAVQHGQPLAGKIVLLLLIATFVALSKTSTPRPIFRAEEVMHHETP